jgi:hypothetical protein
MSAYTCARIAQTVRARLALARVAKRIRARRTRRHLTGRTARLTDRAADGDRHAGRAAHESVGARLGRGAARRTQLPDAASTRLGRQTGRIAERTARTRRRRASARLRTNRADRARDRRRDRGWAVCTDRAREAIERSDAIGTGGTALAWLTRAGRALLVADARARDGAQRRGGAIKPGWTQGGRSAAGRTQVSRLALVGRGRRRARATKVAARADARRRAETGRAAVGARVAIAHGTHAVQRAVRARRTRLLLGAGGRTVKARFALLTIRARTAEIPGRTVADAGERGGTLRAIGTACAGACASGQRRRVCTIITGAARTGDGRNHAALAVESGRAVERRRQTGGGAYRTGRARLADRHLRAAIHSHRAASGSRAHGRAKAAGRACDGCR